MVSESVATAQALALGSGIGEPNCHWMAPADPEITGTVFTELFEPWSKSVSVSSSVSMGFLSPSGSSEN